MTQQIKTQRITGIIMILYFLLTLISFFVLQAVFEFPDILRASGDHRFELFQKNQTFIVPAYYLWTITGLLQIFMAVQLYSLSTIKNNLGNAAIVAGILSGVFQVTGYIRWIVLVPLLSSGYKSGEIPHNMVFFLEKIMNSYLGMTLGEHLGNLFLGIWLVLLGFQFRNEKIIHKSMVFTASLIGFVFLIFSFEPLSSSFSWMSTLTVPVWGFYNVWLIFITISLFKTKENEQAKPISWQVWLGGIIIWLANVIPAFI